MKRFLLATAALGVLSATLPAALSAQSIDLRVLCGPALGIKCDTDAPSRTIQTAPAVKIAPQVSPTPTVRVAPQVQVIKPDVQVTTPRITVPAQVIVPKQVTPRVDVPDVRVVTPTPSPGIKIAPPRIVVNPGTTTGPRVVVTPSTGPNPPAGAVSVDDLRKKLAAELNTVAPGADVVLLPANPGRLPAGPVVRLDPGQAQADLVALRDVAVAAASAAGLGDGAVKVIDQTLTEADVRLSSQDFAGRVAGGPGAIDYKRVDLGKVLSPGDSVVSNFGDRMVVENNGVLRVLRNDDVLMARPGTQVQSFQFQDGSTRNMMMYQDGTQVETIVAPDGTVMRRSMIMSDGSEVVLFDDTSPSQTVMVNELPPAPARQVVTYRSDSDMSEAMAMQASVEAGRTFSLAQIRDIDAVRQLVPEINIDNIHFASGSAAIRPEEAEELAALGYAMIEAISKNPREMFLVEGHTDAVGDRAYNMGLSDRRAESVALALIEYFGVPPQNMVLQGYGEDALLIPTEADEQANRRAAVRRITPLLTEL
ncbi:OmpA family protein [Maliponia aquimaris]|uniref:Putative lipoprotein YiaD n=1 Tax=Maliponia aquimaris TaxID=1673631 RepID=A0A238K126_9RHOB|nr:OmpA family protein [Maliponia aquimaris]SMX36074.1 putative lipoprotein YiaD precursor [Maliponia aquimaris]